MTKPPDRLKFKVVTHVHCVHCGWKGKVEQCSHKKEDEVIDGSLESYIVDLCPECKSEIEYT